MSSKKASSNSSSSKRSASKERSLMTIVVDISPVVWNEREVKRKQLTERAAAKGKKPNFAFTDLEGAIRSLQAFCGAYVSLQRDCVLSIIAVAGNHVAQIFPAKDAMHQYFASDNPLLDMRPFAQQIASGIASLMARPVDTDDAHMAAGLSLALCNMNRFLVANGGSGVSAIHRDGSAFRQDNKDEGGILTLMGSASGGKRVKRTVGAWSSRILLLQASPDRSNDYNAFMNGAFCATKHNIVLDGCFMTGGNPHPHSPFLQQACDLAGGIYLAPSGRSQVGGHLTEVLVSIFLAPRSIRSAGIWQLPTINEVDFRARCFETGETVDMAYCCNQCLSIFQQQPTEFCPTCGANVLKLNPNGETSRGTKRARMEG